MIINFALFFLLFLCDYVILRHKQYLCITPL